MKLYQPFIESFVSHLKNTDDLKQELEELILESIPLFTKTYKISPQYRCQFILLIQLITNHLWSISSGIPINEISFDSIEQMIEIDKSKELKSCYEHILLFVSLYVNQASKSLFLCIIDYFTIIQWLLLDGQNEKYITTFFTNLFTVHMKHINYLKSEDDIEPSEDITENANEMILKQSNDIVPINQYDKMNKTNHELIFQRYVSKGVMLCTIDKMSIIINDITQMKGMKDSVLNEYLVKENNQCEIYIKSCRSSFSGYDEYENFIEKMRANDYVSFDEIEIHIPKDYSKQVYLYFHRYHPLNNSIPIVYPIPQVKDKNDYYYACYDYFKTNSVSSIVIFHVKRN